MATNEHRSVFRDLLTNMLGNLVWVLLTLLAGAVVFLVGNRGWEPLATVVMVSGLVVLGAVHFVTSRRQATRTRSALDRIESSLSALTLSATTIDWTYDSVEHRREFYRQVTELIEDERVLGYHVLTIFRPFSPSELLDVDTRAAMVQYYGALENGLRNREGFRYRRAVVMRHALHDEQATARAEGLLCDLRKERSEFVAHYRAVRELTSTSFQTESRMKFYVDEGRLLDVAFALITDRKGDALALVIELSIAIGSHQPAHTEEIPHTLGLLIIKNPDMRLQRVFQRAHSELFNDRIVEPLGDDLVRRHLAGTR